MQLFGHETETNTRTKRRCDESDALKPIQGARILLVEDNEINQQVARELLEKARLVVEVAYHGQKALEMLEQNRYDCVLMDIQMPVMDGYTATRKIRDDRRFDKLPVLAMTANATVEDRERSLSVGMNAHLNMPIDPKELYSALLAWIEPGERKLPEFMDEPATKEDGDAEALIIEGIDTQTGIARMGGNAESYRKLLSKFVDNQADAVGEIRAARQQGDNEGAVRIAHTLKGVGGTIGAGELQRLGSELEQGLKDSPNADFDTLMVTIESELERVISAINGALGAVEVKEDTAQEPLPADYAERLQALTGQLAEYDAEAGDTLDSLIDKVGDPQVRAKLEQLKRLVDQYDFDGAREIVDELMA